LQGTFDGKKERIEEKIAEVMTIGGAKETRKENFTV